MTWLLVVAGGMAGASLRYLTDRAVRSRNGTAFPWGTFAANMLGCLILGVLTGAVLHGAAAEPVRLLAGTGLCGALSTYSTFSYETVRLAESGSRLLAVANVVVSVVAGIAALVAGTAVAEAVWARSSENTILANGESSYRKEDGVPVRHDHWIGGRDERPAGGAYLPTVDPATREPGDEIAAGSAADVERAVASAVRAQPEWARRSGAERSEVLHRIGDAIEAHADALMELERACTGKTPAQLRMEAGMSAAYFRYYAGVLRAHGGRTIDQGARHHAYTRFEPYGVIAAITPWNLPLNQACRALAPALAAGNAVVAKPSEFTSASTLHLGRLAAEAGLPDGLLNVVTGTGPDAGAPLAAHPGVRRITFTGSVATGRRLAGVAADRLIPVTLELGGKSPLVVFADADLDRAVDAAVAAVATNAGQVCSATARLLIESPVHDEVVARIAAAVERLEPGTDFGPIITEEQFRKVLGHLDAARDSGLVPVTGGSAYTGGPAARGRYVRPTVYAGVPPSAPVAREELFGPVLVTMPFTGEDEALALANGTDYGLVAAVWSGDVARGLRLAERIDAGQVSVNGGPLTIETPFGGFKDSGHGREKGVEALHEYGQVKAISLALD